MRASIALLAWLIVALPVTCGAQVDCERQKTRVDRYVCTSADLEELDARIDALYQQAIPLATPSPATEVRAQYEWKRQRDRCNREDGDAALEACVDALYRARVTVLESTVSRATADALAAAAAPVEDQTLELERPRPATVREEPVDGLRSADGSRTRSSESGVPAPAASYAPAPEPAASDAPRTASPTAQGTAPIPRSEDIDWRLVLLGLGVLAGALYFAGISCVESCHAHGLRIFEKRRHLIAYPLVGPALLLIGWTQIDQPHLYAAWMAALLPGWWALLVLGAQRLNPDAPVGGIVRVVVARVGAICVALLMVLVVFVAVRRKRPSAHHSPAQRAAIDAARYAAGAAAAWLGFRYLDYVCDVGAPGVGPALRAGR